MASCACVPGALSIAFLARPGQAIIVPSGNEKECALILAKLGHEGCNVFAFLLWKRSSSFSKEDGNWKTRYARLSSSSLVIPKAIDFGLINRKDQEAAKEAAIISAAGGYNLLLIGPRAKESRCWPAPPGILPQLSKLEQDEMTRIYSAYGSADKDGEGETTESSFLFDLHDTTSHRRWWERSARRTAGEDYLSALGSSIPRRDSRVQRATLETLRQPLESGEIAISRVGASITYLCRFTLVAAMNPCPCGYFGSRQCTCTERETTNYQQKLSGPLLDRIDLQVELRQTNDRLSASRLPKGRSLREYSGSRRGYELTTARTVSRHPDSAQRCDPRRVSP